MKKSITSINPKSKKQEKKYIIWLIYMQFFFTILLILFGLVSLFKKGALPFFELFLSLTLILMGLNNKLIYKRAYMTFLYFGCGIFFFLFSLLSFIGG